MALFRSGWADTKEAFSFAKKVLLGRKTKETYTKARDAMEYCAEMDDPVAQHQLYAIMLSEGKSDAIKWCISSAESGYASAQYDIALHYLYGDYITANKYYALKWMEMAAYQGYRDAIQKLITLYSIGSKVRKNPERAEYWRAVLNDPEYAERRILIPIGESENLEPINEDTSPMSTGNANWLDLFKPVLQDDVIIADRNKSFVIDAGPGTGKTYALIRRINDLVSNQGVNAENIYVLSFTNAVVNEVKGRLAKLSDLPGSDSQIRNTSIRTFHSFAYWLLRCANDATENENEGWNGWEQISLEFSKLSYDDCMVKGAELLEAHPEIVSDFEYFIVDEIQDINHGKARFVIAILNACIQNNVPFLLMGDFCQAIYDYLDEKNTAGVNIPSEMFYESIVNLIGNRAQYCSFTENYRSDILLQQKTQPIRELILKCEESSFPISVREFGEDLQGVSISEIQSFIENNPEKTVCLMTRSNIAARMLSSELIKLNIEHMNVLSERKGTYPQWMAQILGGFAEHTIHRHSFTEQCVKSGLSRKDAIEIWEKLISESGYVNELMDMESLLNILRRHTFDNLIPKKNNNSRLIVSNIHRSKGLEYDYVCLDNSFLNDYDKDMGEMKTLYVAITRAKIETMRLKGIPSMHVVRDRNKRARKFKTKNKIKRMVGIEISSDGEYPDICHDNYVMSDMKNAQAVINSLKQNDAIELVLNHSTNCYDITAKGETIGAMREYFTSAVEFMNEFGLPEKLTGLLVDGVYSYLGESSTYRTKCENRLQILCPEYGTNRVWNYVLFSGMAQAEYSQ